MSNSCKSAIYCKHHSKKCASLQKLYEISVKRARQFHWQRLDELNNLRSLAITPSKLLEDLILLTRKTPQTLTERVQYDLLNSVRERIETVFFILEKQKHNQKHNQTAVITIVLDAVEKIVEYQYQLFNEARFVCHNALKRECIYQINLCQTCNDS